MLVLIHLGRESITLIHLGLEGITEVDTDRKGRFVSFKIPPFNDRVLCVYAPSGKQQARERFFEGLDNYMENKNENNNTWRI